MLELKKKNNNNLFQELKTAIIAFTFGYHFAVSQRHSYRGCNHPNPHPSSKSVSQQALTGDLCLSVDSVFYISNFIHYFSPTQPYSLFLFSCSSHSYFFLYTFSFFRISVGDYSSCCSVVSNARLSLSLSLLLCSVLYFHCLLLRNTSFGS